MYKTAVYRLVDGGITHQKQQISEKGDIARAGQAMYLLFLMCNTAVN